MHDTPLFYIPPTQWDTHHIPVHGQEFTHLRKVLRLGVNDRVQVTDGRGNLAHGCITSLQGKKAWIAIEQNHVLPRTDSQVIIAPGWAKSLRRGWLLEKAAELEARGLYFWQADHSQGQMPEAVKPNWHSQLVAGAKQSGNPWLPELEIFPGGLSALLEATRDIPRRVFLWEKAEATAMFTPSAPQPQETTLAILGPEGGFSDPERAVLHAHGIQAVSLGQRVLRWETAALLCLGLCWWHKECHPHNEYTEDVPRRVE